ncbi:UNVERIFIED_CONTAM: hypothetical protein Sradi_6537300 [Sesamum radiatum]|uniref:Uncharacterized protein n=1 Tax=Sesamum radiatum TaxID=300843 RepID=A0AAW2JVU7_SESRA
MRDALEDQLYHHIRQWRGATVYWKFIRHHIFSEGDTLLFIVGGPGNLVLDVLQTFLKALPSCKPLLEDLLLGQLRSSLSCSCRRRRYRGTFTSEGAATWAGASAAAFPYCC